MLSVPAVSEGCPLEPWKRGDPQDKRATQEYKKAVAKAAKEGKPPPPPPKQPAAAGEDSKKAQVNDGWNRKKVEKDVMETGRIQNFTQAEMAEWRALFNFWEEHTTPESLPPSPHTIQMDDGRNHTMEGPPSWEELWRVLRRFERPHHTSPPAGQQPPPPQQLVLLPQPNDANADQFLSAPDRLSIMNRVGGDNTLPAHRKGAEARKSRLELMLERGRNVSSVSLDRPYFASLQHCEGELLVGIAIPRERTVDKKLGTIYNCEWFKRKPCAPRL